MGFNLLLKTLTQLVDSRKGLFAPNTPDPLCAKGTRLLIRFPGMEAFNDALTFEIGYPSSLGSSFVIEIQTHAKIGLE